MRSFTPPSKIPLKEEVVRLTVAGVRTVESGFGGARFRGGVIVPIDIGVAMPRLGFSDVWDLLDRTDAATGNSSMARTTGFPCAILTRMLAHKVSIITGSTSGLGAATAARFAAGRNFPPADPV